MENKLEQLADKEVWDAILIIFSTNCFFKRNISSNLQSNFNKWIRNCVTQEKWCKRSTLWLINYAQSFMKWLEIIYFLINLIFRKFLKIFLFLKGDYDDKSLKGVVCSICMKALKSPNLLRWHIEIVHDI